MLGGFQLTLRTIRTSTHPSTVAGSATSSSGTSSMLRKDEARQRGKVIVACHQPEGGFSPLRMPAVSERTLRAAAARRTHLVITFDLARNCDLFLPGAAALLRREA